MEMVTILEFHKEQLVIYTNMPKYVEIHGGSKRLKFKHELISRMYNEFSKNNATLAQGQKLQINDFNHDN